MPVHHLRFDSSQSRPLPNNAIGKRMYRSIPTKDETRLYDRFSPFDMLPVELQDEIFSYCLPPYPHFDVDEGPLLISRVCRAWRFLVLNTPKLWSAFEIEVVGSGSSSSLRDLKIMSTMKLWLERSKQYPLSVRVIHLPVGRVPDHRSAELLAALIPEARRWKHVHFFIPSANLSALQQSLPAEFPALESFTVQMKGLWTSGPFLDVSSMNIPWHQLTDLDLQLEPTHLFTLDKCLNILSGMDRLTRCRMNLDCTFDPHNVRTSHIPLTSLETLHLILQGGNNETQVTAVNRPEASLVQFLDVLSLPSLHTLRLEWLVQQSGARAWTTKHSGFLSFLRGASQTIQRLSFVNLPLSEPQLLECLVEIPSVTHLELKFSLSDIENDPITESLLAAITSPPQTGKTSSTTPVLPDLEYFNLQCSGKRYTNVGLLAFVESRRRSGTGHDDSIRRGELQSFHLLSMNPVLREVEKCVRNWNLAGMDVLIENLVIR